MSLRERTRPGLGIIEPCLPSPVTMARFVLLLIFLLGASSAKAQLAGIPNLNGNWLYTVCTKDQLVCRMWISGFQAGIISSQKLAQVNKLKPASCIPYDVTADQAKDIIG